MATWNIYLVWWDDDSDETTRLERISVDSEHDAHVMVDAIRDSVNAGLPRIAVKTTDRLGFVSYPLAGIRIVDAMPADSSAAKGYEMSMEQVREARAKLRRGSGGG